MIVTLDNRSGLLRPGMNAEVEILINQATDVLLVPNGAMVGVRDVGPAAMALGLDPETLDLGALAGGGMRRPGGAGGAAGQRQARPAAATDGADNGTQVPGDSARAGMARLRAQVESGEITQDSMRAVIRARMAAGDPRDASPAGGIDAEARPSVVFVMNAQGQPEPRVIQVGLSDWDNTQVVSGLDGEETLAVVGAAQLQAQQAEWLERIRSRSGGSPFGGRR
ncbi:MAG TPA: hypothetical protein VK858_02700 [Longimicrobiales bacterium]|nr:hypothetical protein [Longimicrobiales bacterium]